MLLLFLLFFYFSEHQFLLLLIVKNNCKRYLRNFVGILIISNFPNIAPNRLLSFKIIQVEKSALLLTLILLFMLGNAFQVRPNKKNTLKTEATSNSGNMTGTFSSHYARTSHQNQNQQQQHSPGYVPADYNHRSKYPGVVPFRTGSPSSPLPPDELSLPQLISVQHNNSNSNHHKSGLT
jgi:hypothetical protein